MKLITRDTDYAIRALCFIAKKKNEVVAVTQLVEELKIPRPFLRKILQKLTKSRILKSFKGQGGGFTLACSPSNIFLTDLIKIFQGKFKLNECFFRKIRCKNISICPLKKKIDNIEKLVLKELDSVNLDYLLKH